MLVSDIGWPDESVQVHLADSQLDLFHQQTAHFDEAWAALDKQELAVEVDIGACKCGMTIGTHVLEQLSMHGKHRDDGRSVSGESDKRGFLQNRPVAMKIQDVVAAEPRNLRRMVRPSGHLPLSYQSPNGGCRSGANYAVALAHSALGNRGTRAIDHVNDALAQGVAHDRERKCVPRPGDPGRVGRWRHYCKTAVGARKPYRHITACGDVLRRFTDARPGACPHAIELLALGLSPCAVARAVARAG